MKRAGFTLIEVMISMFIMAMLTVLVSASIRSAVQNKKKLEAKMAIEATLFDALRVVKMDVERAFHYQDVFFEIETLAIQQLQKAKNNPGGNPPPGTAPPPTPPPPVLGQPGAGGLAQRQPPVKLTHFLGDASSMHFTTLNHFRTKYNAQESNQMEVGYFVDSCEARDGSGSTDCLWRRSNTSIDDDVEKDGPKVVVAEHVKSFKLEYRSNQQEAEWVKQWRSDNRGRPDHQNKFPSFVKIFLEVQDSDDRDARTLGHSVVVQVYFPNNESHLQQQAQIGQQPARTSR
jgi:prepilin-type N-terminal cleavage/methylation domain-containing protein